MIPVWSQLRAELRLQPRSGVLAVGFVAIVGGLALLAVAGARRTDNALDRQARWARVSDIAVIPRSPARPTAPAFSLSEIRRLPEVRSAYAMPYLYFRARTPADRMLTFADLHLHDPPDPRVGRTLDRFKIVAGRMANPHASDQLMVSTADAARLGLRVGSRLDVRFGSPRQQPGLSEQVNDPSVPPDRVRYRGPRATLEVVGLFASLGTLAIDFGGPVVYRPALLTPAFYAQYSRRVVELPLIFTRLRNGPAAVPALGRSLARLAPGGDNAYQPIGGATAQLQRHADVDAVLLDVLAGLLTVLGTLGAGQLLARRSRAASAALTVLHSLGMERRRLLAVGIARSAGLGVPGAVLAVGLAVGLSPLTPVGDVARLAEPNPGVSFDVGVLGSGALLIVLVVVLAGLPSSWQVARSASLPPRIDTHPDVLGARWGRRLARLPLAAMLGARLAVLAAGHRRSGSRLLTITASLAIALIAAVLGCRASFVHLTRSPRLYGQNWEFALGGGGAGNLATTIARLHQDPLVGATVAGARVQAEIDGRTVGLLGLGSGAIRPTVIDGRAAMRPGEILLGRATLRALQRAIGNTVFVSLGPRTVRMRIVGLGVIPDISEALRLGNGGIVTLPGLRQLEPEAPTGYAFVQLRHPTPAAESRFEDSYQAAGALAGLPADLHSIQQASRALPLIEALLGTIAAAALLQALTATVRSRRRELALLKALGLVPQQARTMITWQALLLATIALGFGLPVGALAGRWIWLLFADELGVASVAVVPVAQLLALALATIVLAALLAVVPGQSVVRLRSSLILRSE